VAEDFKIHDMFVLDLSWKERKLTILKDYDHLLRRFGQVDMLRISSGRHVEVSRRKADELWTVISGTASIQLEDQRIDSPSFGELVILELAQESPQAVLVPFGVKCIVSCKGKADLIRISTHADDPQSGDIIRFL